MKFKKQLFVIGVVLFFGLLIFVSNNGETAETKVIRMSGEGFIPKSVVIKLGDTVIFENADGVERWPASNIHPTHLIYSQFDPKKPILPGQSWQFKFEKAGRWQFHDHLKPQFSGNILVQEADLTGKSYFEKLNFKFFKILEYEKKYNPGIVQNSTEVFSDDIALYSHVKKYGSKKTIEYLHSLEGIKGSCHDQAHKVGRFAYEIFNEKAFKECSGECHSGCYHGAAEAYFKEKGTANLEKDLTLLCSNELNPFFSHQCIHGIGHGLMAWANYEIFDALDSCNLLKSRQDSCWTGVFMENIVGSLASGHSTNYLSNDPYYPCTVVDEKYEETCYFYQTTRMIQLEGYDAKRLDELCSKLSKNNQYFCFQSMGRDVASRFADPEGAVKDCMLVKDDYNQDLCLGGAVQDYFWDSSGQDDAIKFCNKVEGDNKKLKCFSLIIDRAKDIIKLGEFNTFCQKLGEPYTASCNAPIGGN